MARETGFEPIPTESESAILPLDDSPMVPAIGFDPIPTVPQTVVLATNTTTALFIW